VAAWGPEERWFLVLTFHRSVDIREVRSWSEKCLPKQEAWERAKLLAKDTRFVTFTGLDGATRIVQEVPE
jgi:hypothetical protein